MELPCVAIGHPDVSYIAGLDEVMERVHRLCHQCVGVEAVALEDVDIV